MTTGNRQPTTDTVRHFRVDRKDLVYLTFILGGYEGMCTLSTVEKSGVIVSVTIPAGFARDMDGLLTALQSEIPLEEVAWPRPAA